jgi:hypothetical protein
MFDKRMNYLLICRGRGGWSFASPSDLAQRMAHCDVEMPILEFPPDGSYNERSFSLERMFHGIHG